MIGTFQVGDQVRFIKKHRDRDGWLASLVGTIVRINDHMIYMKYNDGTKGYDYAENIELLTRLVVKGNELSFEQGNNES